MHTSVHSILAAWEAHDPTDSRVLSVGGMARGPAASKRTQNDYGCTPFGTKSCLVGLQTHNPQALQSLKKEPSCSVSTVPWWAGNLRLQKGWGWGRGSWGACPRHDSPGKKGPAVCPEVSVPGAHVGGLCLLAQVLAGTSPDSSCPAAQAAGPRARVRAVSSQPGTFQGHALGLSLTGGGPWA